MLSRAASNASARLRRARSSASINGGQQGTAKPDYIDPEIARQHALAAASYAFQRASERGVVGVGGSNGLSRNNSTASDHLGRGRTLSRQQSVKFAGKSGAERRRFIKSRDRVDVARTKSESVSSVHRQLRNDASLRRQGSTVISVFPYDEHCTPEDDIASTPSSYRRLRKAKSMASPRKNACTYGTPESDYDIAMRNTNGLAGSEGRPDLGEALLRAPRSMSFLRGGRECVPRSVRKSHDAAVQMARKQYLEQLENQRLKARQSFVLSSAARRQQKAFRKTVRTTSQTSYGSAISSFDQQIRTPKSGKLSSKARNISLTIKETLKRVFHRSSDNRDNVPIQQVEATRQHFRPYVSSDAGVHESRGDIPIPPEGTVSHVSSRVPSLQIVPSDIQPRSQAGSIRSVHSDGDRNDTLSCIASSSNSTASSSWVTRQAAERKRLSIIQEGGGTQRPPSPGGNGASGYKAFHRPMRTSDCAPSPVDSQRVYSALMKRLDKSRFEMKQEEEKNVQADDYTNTTIAAPAHRIDPISARRTPTTIRHIVEDSDDERSESRIGVRVSKSVIFRPLPEREADDVFSPANSTKDSRVPRSRHASGSSREDSASLQPSLNYFPTVGSLGDQSILTPQQAADHNEKTRTDRGHVLREARSTFFPNLGGPRVTTPSPYKRALGNVCSENERTTIDLTASAYNLQKLRKISENSVSQRPDSVAGCSSVYSRTTSGDTPKLEDFTTPLGRREPSETGTAIIITDRISRNGISPLRRPTNLSSGSSNEWKAWMSSEIAGLDKQNALMGHQREGAQIDGDDTLIGCGDGNLPPQASRILPLSTVHGNVVIRQVPRYKVPSGVVIPLIDTGQLESAQSALLSQQHGHGIRPVSSVSSLCPTNTYVTNSSMGRLNSASRRDKLRARSAVDMRLRYSPIRVRGFAADGEVLKGRAAAGLSEAAGGQLGPVSSGGSGHDENSSPVGGEGYEEVDGTGLMGPLEPPARGGVVGSQRMVDLFLSSRRRRIRGSDGSGKNAFL
ncbi:hypothetical protein FGG08_005202 [Glutinoglossum americanum]|uniref:Ig-like domain-containing protein n=1 Tax=Glutinoglossum americanum TaxID=1670608 RepID=A0A9P8L1N5_9PEZI|nr:hypothetical protein FGG08_005202 [Glutinoglossum americanum]